MSSNRYQEWLRACWGIKHRVVVGFSFLFSLVTCNYDSETSPPDQVSKAARSIGQNFQFIIHTPTNTSFQTCELGDQFIDILNTMCSGTSVSPALVTDTPDSL